MKLMLLQNYGWPTGPAKIWLWLARRPYEWPRATGPAGSTTPVSLSNIKMKCKKHSYSFYLILNQSNCTRVHVCVGVHTKYNNYHHSSKDILSNQRLWLREITSLVCMSDKYVKVHNSIPWRSHKNNVSVFIGT